MLNHCLIGGKWIAAQSGKELEVHNPANGELIGTVPDCGEAETLLAIDAASRALALWRNTSLKDRAAVLGHIASSLRVTLNSAAETLTREQGKPLKESRTEIEFGLSLIEWFAREGQMVADLPVESQRPGFRAWKKFEPVGVCAAITPWNFPFSMIARKVAPALMAGCPVILKPAPETPLTALLFARVCADAGIPAGVFNCITGDAVTIGSTLMHSEVVRKVSFTGSTAVGKLLIRQSADTVKKLTLELGGNAPFIVCEDANLSQAVEATRWAKYRNAGQACVGVNRFLVHERVYDQFLAQYCELSASLTVGQGESDIGPLITNRAVDRISTLVEDALDKGAVLALGEIPERGSHWMHPVILGDVTREMRIWHEEIFGPVSTIRKFSDDQEAVRLANDTRHGLAAYLFSGSPERCQQMVSQLEAGMICVNDFSLAGAQIPFGGIKESGYGVEGGHEAMYEYLNAKYVTEAVVP